MRISDWSSDVCSSDLQHAAQVISRHWIITDGNQHVQEVRGLGVVGQQPLLKPGETFEYTSGCPLPTPVGSMRGSYLCVGETGVPFDVAIHEFVLAMPRTRSEEHTSELQSLMRISYAVF